MFSRVSNGSKIAISHLVRWMKTAGLDMLDCQLTNPHLTSLGAQTIPRDTFLKHLNNASKMQINWTFNDYPIPWGP